MASLPRSAHDIAREQRGLLTGPQLSSAGVADHHRSRLLANGTLVPVAQGLYRVASHAESFGQRCLAASLAVPDCVLSGPTAGRLYGLRRCWTDDIHLLSHRSIDLPFVIGHRTNLLNPADIAFRSQMRLLRPARLVCDLAVYLSDADLDSVIEQVLDRRLATIEVLRSVAGQFMASGRNGSRRLRRVLNERPDWTRPPESELELRLARALTERGLEVVPQFIVGLDGGRFARLDLAVPSLRFAVEVDHAEWHSGRLAVQHDKQRDRQLMRLGWTVARVTDADIERRLRQTVDQLLDIAARLMPQAS